MDPNNPNKLELPIEWHLPDQIVSRYATNMVVQFTENEFIVSFFETVPPLLLGSPDAIKEKVKEIKSVRGGVCCACNHSACENARVY